MAFFKLPDHYVFNYKPRYYDPQKEQMEKRVQKIKKKLGIEDENKNIKYKADINFRRDGMHRRRKDRNALARFLVILTFLLLMAYILIFTGYFDSLMKLIK